MAPGRFQLRYARSLTRSRMRTIRIGAVLLGIAGSAAAQANDRNPLDATAIVDLGGFFTSTDIRVRLDGEGGRLGDPVDLDDSFGLVRFVRLRMACMCRS